MLSQEVIGRVTTDLELNKLYEAMLRAASVTIVNKIRFVFYAPARRPSYEQRVKGTDAFQKKCAEFLSACRRQNVSVPRQISLARVQKFLLRQLMPS